MDDHLETLARRIQAGDAAAANELCTLTRPALLRMARSWLANAGESGPEDAVQLAQMKFVGCLQKPVARRVRPMAMLTTFLKNVCVDIYRKRNAGEKREGGDAADLPAPAPDQDFWRGVDPERLRRELLRLGSPCSSLLLHIYYHAIPIWLLAALFRGRPVSKQAIYKMRDNCLKKLAGRLNIPPEHRFKGRRKRRGGRPSSTSPEPADSEDDNGHSA